MMYEILIRDQKLMLRQEMHEYINEIGELTAEEKAELRTWVAAGHSVYNNPCLLYDESGHPMDYITACRISEEMTPDWFDPTTWQVADTGCGYDPDKAQLF